MDDDFGFDSPRRSQNFASKGRRARGNESIEKQDGGGNEDSVEPSAKPTRRMGGWGEEDASESPLTARSGKKKGEAVETFKANFTNFDDEGESDNEIPMIPDLEDDSNEMDMGNQIAMAPSVAVNKVATYKELDSDLQKSAQFSMLDNDIDLKLLSKYLLPEADAKEDDKLWDWDPLFTEVSSELQAEWDTDNITSNTENNNTTALLA